MKHYKYLSSLFLLMLFLGGSWPLNSQDEPVVKQKKPVRNTFESTLLIDQQTVEVPYKGTFQWDIQHRFGTVNNGYDDYYGLAAPSNIRLGFNYVAFDNLQLGFGITKERKVWDFSAKYAIFKQKREGGFPFSLTYYAVAGVDSRPFENFTEDSDRLSYFNQLIIARKFDDFISLQVAPNISYFNNPFREYDSEGTFVGRMKSAHWALAFGGRLKYSESSAIIVQYEFPLMSQNDYTPKNGMSIGIEFTSSAHAFQLFIGNYKSILPQYNATLNQNEIGNSDILIGFNITRLWSF
jgi:hypothetical protein